MANTTNFGWETPDDTDLVKDGAAAMRTLGSAIDTSMADLKGGTTGQMLVKNSATDMDFIWTSPNPGDITGVSVTSPLTGGGTSGDVTVGIQDGTTAQKGAVQLTDSTASTSTTTAATPNAVKTAYDLANGAIPKSTVTTNGDIIYATGSSAVTRLGIGTSGQLLSVSGGVPAWTTVSSGAMTLLASGSLSGTTVTLSDISSSYKNLQLVIRNFKPATDGTALNMRFNGTSSTSYFNSSSTSGTAQGANSSLFNNVTLSQDNSTATGLAIIDIPDYANSGTWKFYDCISFMNNSSNSAQTDWANQRGCYFIAEAIYQIDLTCGSGNFTSGNYYLYGVK